MRILGNNMIGFTLLLPYHFIEANQSKTNAYLLVPCITCGKGSVHLNDHDLVAYY